MTHAIARLLESVLRLLLPTARGRHRLSGDQPAERPAEASPARIPHARAPLHTYALHGEDSALVRPYLIAHEQRQEERRQRARRRALWLAVHGVDIGPRLIHGVEVSA
ncbi:hypothetical protein [Streptomyces cavernicola]|uniref:Secreted protein n=1 Tax=Streptomyces cavernicola TaxID=3043613 RepID=A0ABT6SIC5_9ACTN|nr:hypothetical protein [Streptomyces sp. B-S-A6]MDI3407952.1 hypothetical protein [Streptomyces sp. B-S-A6]